MAWLKGILSAAFIAANIVAVRILLFPLALLHLGLAGAWRRLTRRMGRAASHALRRVCGVAPVTRHAHRTDSGPGRPQKRLDKSPSRSVLSQTRVRRINSWDGVAMRRLMCSHQGRYAVDKRPNAKATLKDPQPKLVKDYPPVGQHERYIASIRQKGIDNAIAATKAVEPLLKEALASN